MNELKTPERLGYAVGDLGINLFFISTMTWLTYFYTDILGISAAAAAGVMFVARLIDAVTDPLMGMIAERTRTRWGRLRPYVFVGAVPLGIVSVLLFTVPEEFDTGAKIAWAYVTYIAFGILYTVVVIPYSTLTASLTQDHEERTLLSTLRMGAAFSGGFIVSVFMMPLVGLFDSQAEGFQTVMAAFSLVAVALLWITATSVTERVAPPPSARLTVGQSLTAVFKNPPLLVVMLLFTCGMLAFTVRQAIAVYYFEHVLQRMDLLGTFFACTLSAMLVGLIGVPRLAARFGKSGAIIIGAVLTIVGCVGMYYAAADSPWLTIVWGCVVALGGTPIAVLGWAMIPDTVEYAQWRHGMRADGAIYSFSSFFQKLAKTVGGAGVALGLAAAGYVAHEAQSEQSREAIRLMMTLGPASIMLVTMLVASFYTLDRSAHERIVAELNQREGGATLPARN